MKTRQPRFALTSTATARRFTPARSGLLQRKCACGGTPGPTGECEKCRKNRLQRKIDNSECNESTLPPIVHEVLRSRGQPLDAETREFMEPRFGHDFSRVRVHTDERAAESARAVNALAYTVGRELVFGDGLYSPGTEAGTRLLAHELAHVVQQNGTVGDLTPLRISPEGDHAEREADMVANELEAGSCRNRITLQQSPALRRKVKIDKPANKIPNPTGKGLVQTNAETIEGYLGTICSGGNVKVDRASGVVTMDPGGCTKLRAQPGVASPAGATRAPVSRTPEGCSCLCDLVNPAGRTEHEWTIRVDDTQRPHTSFDGDAEAIGGTGGTVTTISPNSPKVFGAVTKSGKREDLDPWLILGHELCGHAWLGNFGMSEPETMTKTVGRQPLTVDRENALRAEHSIEARGRSFRDPFCGESYERVKGTKPGTEFFKHKQECEQARARCKKPGGGSFKIDEQIPDSVSCS
jgi:hypothetical protein